MAASLANPEKRSGQKKLPAQVPALYGRRNFRFLRTHRAMNRPPQPAKDRRETERPGPDGLVDRRSGADRRVHERILVDWAVDYRASDTFLFAYISDISAMGIFVRTRTPEPPGARLNLRFSPPGGPAMDLEGEVIWINPPRNDDDESRQPGMGIQFVDLGDAQREQLVRLVRTFAYLPDEDEAIGTC